MAAFKQRLASGSVDSGLSLASARRARKLKANFYVINADTIIGILVAILLVAAGVIWAVGKLSPRSEPPPRSVPAPVALLPDEMRASPDRSELLFSESAAQSRTGPRPDARQRLDLESGSGIRAGLEGGSEREAEGGAGRRAPEGPEARDVFAQYRLERERARGRRIAMLEQLLREGLETGSKGARSGDGEAQLVSEVRRAIEEMARIQQLEAEIEVMLRAKGFDQVLVGLAGESANVLMGREITAGEAATIGEVVARTAGISAERITIVDGTKR